MTKQWRGRYRPGLEWTIPGAWPQNIWNVLVQAQDDVEKGQIKHEHARLRRNLEKDFPRDGSKRPPGTDQRLKNLIAAETELISTKETPKDIPLPGTGSRYNKDGSKRELGVGFGEPSSVGATSASNSQEAINTPRRSRWGPDETRGHTLNRTGSVGGKGSVANNKEILRRMREDQKAKVEQKAAQLQPSNENLETVNAEQVSNKNSVEKLYSEGAGTSLVKMPDGSYQRHPTKTIPKGGEIISTDGKKPDKKPEKPEKEKSAWSQMNAGEKVEVISNALQKLDGSKDELHWMGTGWGGIGSGGHSGYVG